MKLISMITKRIGLGVVAIALMGAGGDGGIPARLVGNAMSDGRALGIAFDTIDPWNQLLLCEHLRNAPLARDHAAIARA